MKNFVTILFIISMYPVENFDFALPGQIQDYKNLMRNRTKDYSEGSEYII